MCLPALLTAILMIADPLPLGLVHCYFDYFPEHPFLSLKSISLVTKLPSKVEQSQSFLSQNSLTIPNSTYEYEMNYSWSVIDFIYSSFKFSNCS